MTNLLRRRHRSGIAFAALLGTVGLLSPATAFQSAPPIAATQLARLSTARDPAVASAVRVSKDLLLASISASERDEVTITLEPAKGKQTKLKGSVPWSDSGKGLALVQVDASQLDAASLPIFRIAKAGPQFAEPLRLLGPDGSQIATALQSAKRLYLIPRNTIQIAAEKKVVPGILIDDCGNVAGAVGTASSANAEAYLPKAIENLIVKAKGEAETAETICSPIGDDGLRQLTARAQEADDAAHKRASDTDQAIAALQKGGKSAQGRLPMLERAAESDKAAIATAEKTIAALHDHRTSHKRSLILGIASLIVVVLLVAGGILFLFRNKRQLEDREKSIAVLSARTANVERKMVSRGWRDVVLTGPDGILKISATKLSEDGDGAIIGRNKKEADIPFGPEDVSRLHARLFVRSDRLWIEDLKSLKGTFVNGRAVDAASPVSLANGDNVRIASHDFELRIL